MSGSNDQVARLLALVPYLQNHEGIPVQKVADEFGVPVKQIYRDIEVLMVTGTADEHGSLIDFDYAALEDEGLIYIRDAQFLPRPLRLARNEGIALLIGLRALGETADDEQRPVIDSALGKIEGAVGEKPEVVVHAEPVDPGIVRAVRSAVAERRRLEIDYSTETRDERSTRQVDPLRMFSANGRHYLEGWCLRAQDVRFFRLDRIHSAVETGQPAEARDAEPRDLAAGLFDNDVAPSAVLDLQPEAHWMVEYYGATEVTTHGPVLRAKIVGADWAWLVRLVLRHAGSVQVVSPPKLAEEASAAASAALAAYDGFDSPQAGHTPSKE
ncbi:MAG TPA: WYL domain-containing protein [Aeromicrobium sp.]|nr:WYL domain-containing protein [Aeromicrobium sp.]